MVNLQEQLPWTRSPLIANAPMGGIAGPDLALAVTRAGGLGQIGAVNDMKVLAKQLETVGASLATEHLPDHSKLAGVLPIGVGFLLFITKLAEAADVVRKHKPAIIWLFAAHDSLKDYQTWAQTLRDASPQSRIWIQIGSSALLALEVVQSIKPDAIVLQGSDAGGHGFERGAGVISLLPETLDLLSTNGLEGFPVLAAGGIVDARSAAAAFTLGAAGVVMGTRFLAARETDIPNDAFRERIISAQDGAMATVRAKVFDELKGRNMWPELYDGRALVSQSWNDWKAGRTIDHIREKHAAAVIGGDAGFGEVSDRAAVWAGTGVGLVNKIQDADEIVREVRDGVAKVLDDTRSRF